MLYYIILYYIILYYVILYYTILYYPVLYYIILYYTVLYYTILHYTTLHNTTLYYIILFYFILFYFIVLLIKVTLFCLFISRKLKKPPPVLHRLRLSRQKHCDVVFLPVLSTDHFLITGSQWTSINSIFFFQEDSALVHKLCVCNTVQLLKVERRKSPRFADCKSAKYCTTRGHPLPLPQVIHPGPCNSVGMRSRKDRQTDTDTQTRVTTVHFASSTTDAKCNYNTLCFLDE